MPAGECCIKECLYTNRKGQKGIKKRLFKVPENGTIERENWEKSVGKHVKKRFRQRKFLFVCEDHFEDECLMRDPILIFVNGKTETVPRKRVRLLPDTLPTKFPKQLSTNNSIDLQRFCKERQPLTSSKNLQTSITESIPVSIKEESNDPLSLNSHDQIQISPLFVNVSCTEDFFVGSNTSTNIHSVNENVAYDVNKLIDDWNNNHGVLRVQTWGYVRTSSTGVKFVCYLYWGPSTWRGILVNDDMTLQVMIGGNLVNYKTTVSQISHLQDLLSAIREVSALYVCEGSFEEYCPTGLYMRKYIAKCNRCTDCQKKFRLQYERHRQQRVRAEKRMLKEKRVKKNLRQQVARLNDKAVKLKEAVEKLQKELKEEQDKVSAVNEDFMKHPFVQKMPSEMQEMIRACWQLSKCSDKRNVRHSKAWLSECLLLYGKSRKVYKHLRDHKILPLPCFNTINKYAKDLKPSDGFDPAIFETLKMEIAQLHDEDKGDDESSAVMERVTKDFETEAIHYEVYIKM